MSKQGFNERVQSKIFKRKATLESEEIKFESDDSEGSDISYESSIESDDDIPISKVDYFKQEMARFFMNFPQLINKNIIQPTQTNKDKNDWEFIAGQVLSEAKQSSVSIEQLAKRIAQYRTKVEKNDIIDLILKEHQVLLKQIESEMVASKSQCKESSGGLNQKVQAHLKSVSHANDSMYFSWRKRKQSQLRNNSNRKYRNSKSPVRTSNFNLDIKNKQNLSVDKNNNPKNNSNELKLSGKNNSLNRRHAQTQPMLEQQQLLAIPNRTNSLYKNTNLQLKTEVAKQLLEELKKYNSNDQLAIKRTIIKFLVRHRENMQKELMSKNTLSQKINKFYSEDSKELAMFYPIKKVQNGGELIKITQADSFVQVLKEISEGPLMKYWKLIQQKKL